MLKGMRLKKNYNFINYKKEIQISNDRIEKRISISKIKQTQ
jgi:hypothetical protein